MYVMAKQNGEMNHATKDYICDTQDDMNAIPATEYTMGSTCYIIKDSSKFIADSDLAWQAVKSSGGGMGPTEVQEMIDAAIAKLTLNGDDEAGNLTITISSEGVDP